jgi:hypothetical protein
LSEERPGKDLPYDPYLDRFYLREVSAAAATALFLGWRALIDTGTGAGGSDVILFTNPNSRDKQTRRPLALTHKVGQ